MPLERFAVGTLIGGRYAVLSRLGRGGMGDVLCVEDRRFGSAKVALKMLNYRFRNTKYLERMKNEAALTVDFRHPNVVSTLDFHEGGVEGTWIVMELVPGRNLEGLLVKDQGLPVEEALPIALQVCAALRAAHARGIVHRDLKPSNILVTPDGEAKVADFGIARAVESDLKLTATGEMVGTVLYAAPEQSVVSDPDPRMDVYSFGIMLFELLSGRLPFMHDDPLTVCHMHRTVAMPRLRAVKPGVPLWLEALIEGCTEKNPARRIRSFDEIIEIMLVNAPRVAWRRLPGYMRGRDHLFMV